ncbi:hypothetical protein Tco_0876028, partial [Tanacetum coccineum]
IERPSTTVKGVLFRCVTDVSRDKSSGRTCASMFGKGKRKLPLVALLMQPRNFPVNRYFNNSCGRSRAPGGCISDFGCQCIIPCAIRHVTD